MTDDILQTAAQLGGLKTSRLDQLDLAAMMIGRLYEQRAMLMEGLQLMLDGHQHESSECKPCRDARWCLAEIERLKKKYG